MHSVEHPVLAEQPPDTDTDTAPPVLAVPQIDLSFPIDSILEAGEKYVIYITRGYALIRWTQGAGKEREEAGETL